MLRLRFRSAATIEQYQVYALRNTACAERWLREITASGAPCKTVSAFLPFHFVPPSSEVAGMD
jgi:hypothetical protein